ncbi:BAG family molecular chaperone regulator 6 [Abrus precatorius]|uniref:BAG family molecular chaperone regulator 6 n=1 Tax=Abrus precatorius TaxID=3816 RepID=A0A8B8K1Q7_ABRPR|nr:BAG family molecular chaperone regulator 6 [Abrus precatorius]
MMPTYRSMDSYPYQRNPTPFPHCYHPSIETIPPQINMDPSKAPFSYDQHWPCCGNYGHPMHPHFCCGHNYFPNFYGYRPSYPHAPTPMYYSGGCPAYGEPFNVPYSPQPHYTMELPRYEYDKYMPRDHHCCWCPHLPCNQKEGKSVKIEAHEPDGGKQVNDDLVPIQFRNYPYPFVWVPPEYKSNRQLKNPNTTEGGEQNKISHDRTPTSPENFSANVKPVQEPRVWNGWLPFDIKGAPSMFHDGYGTRNHNQETDNNRKESEDGRMNQKHQSEHKRSEFPFIFWLPYYNKQEESGKTSNHENASSSKIIEEVLHTSKSVPVKSHDDEGVMNERRSNHVESTNIGASDVVEKVNNARSIPVKQLELHRGKNDSQGNGKKEMIVSPNQVEENVTKKDSCTGDKKRQSTSPSKASKLPPVCLRIDPLPRKKNGNGSSRSPSPPSSEEHSQATAGEKSKTPSCHMNDNKAQSNSSLQNTTNTSEKVEPKVKTIQVMENKTGENKDADYKDGYQTHVNVNIPSEVPTGTKETCTNGDTYMTEDKKVEKGEENKMEETQEVREVKDTSIPVDKGQKERRVLSDADAAVLIQATYRGYQVRKWEPLKKLKQIDEIRKEVTDVQGCVQAFQSSSDLQNDEKRKIAIGETIMRLLLQLDTIQGLHPSFREIRKSLAKELTTLQERLDSVMAKKTQQQMQDFVAEKPIEVTPLNMQKEECVQEQQKEKVAIPVDSFEGIKDGSKSPRASDGASESQSPIHVASNEGTNLIAPLNGLGNEVNRQVVIANDSLNFTSDLSETDKMLVEPEVKSEVNNIPIETDKLDMTVWEELPVGVIDEDINDVSIAKDEHDDVSSGSLLATDSANDGLGSVIHAMMQLPKGLLDEDEKDGETNNSRGEAQAETEEWVEELSVRLDEDLEKSKGESYDGAQTYEEVLPAEERVSNADEKTSSSTVKETKPEKPQEEEQEEVQSSGESDGWVKIEFQREDELKEHSPVDIEVKCETCEEVGIDTKFPSLITQVHDHELGNGDACLEASNLINDWHKEDEKEEKVAQRDGGLNGDAKLVEENEKLREMTKKLLETGNEQLSVISDLTGRVKDLEKKLAKSRSKRLKTKRYRPATSKMSCMKSSK